MEEFIDSLSDGDAVIAWRLDRAFDQLIATLDDPDADLDARAGAYEQLAAAARQVATQVVNDDGRREPSSALARCAFCGKPARDVKRSSPGRPAPSATNASTSACGCSTTTSATAGAARSQTETPVWQHTSSTSRSRAADPSQAASEGCRPAW